MSVGPLDPAPPTAGKLGRNEARKLSASWLNTASVAFFIAAIIQPIVRASQRPFPFALAEVAASAIFLIVSVAFFVAAQSVVRRLED